MEDQRRVLPAAEEDETVESSAADEYRRAHGGEISAPPQDEVDESPESTSEENCDLESDIASVGDSFDFHTPLGKRLDGSKALSLEILAEAGLKSAGKGRLRIDYAGVFQDMLRTLGVFPICVMAFSIVGFLLYRFPGNASEWEIFQYLTIPSFAWLSAWRWLETFYVLDVRGRKIDYHLQIGGAVVEIGNLRRNDLIGVSLTGQMMVDGWEYAVVAGLKNGKLVRLSDYSKNFLEANRKAGVIARLLDTPFIEGRQEAYAEMQIEPGSEVFKIHQIPGIGPNYSGGGCILALELFFVPLFSLGFGWFLGPLMILSYFWGRYWWTK